MESLLQPSVNPLDIAADEIAKAYSELLKIPNLSSAHFLNDSNEFLNIHSEWSVVDMISKEKCSFVKNYSILKSSLASGTPMIAVSSAIPYTNIKLSAFSTSGSKKAVLTDLKAKDGSIGELLRIYSNDTLLTTFDLKKLDKHKGVYTNSEWGRRMVFSQDETKLAYLAEKKLPKAESFLEFKDCNSNKNEETRKGEEFEFRQSWGEQMNDAFESVIVILDLETNEFQVLDLPDKLFPCDLQWVNNTAVIGTGYVHCLWRLGLIYCNNRESRIFKVGIDGKNFKYLSAAGVASFSPRVNPSSSYVIWQERSVGGPHRRSVQLMGMQLGQEDTPCVLYDYNPRNGIPIYENFPAKCWSLDGNKFYVVTCNEIDSVLLEFSMSSDYRIVGEPLKLDGIKKLYSIGKDYILVSRDSSIESTKLNLLGINQMKTIEFDITKGIRAVSRAVHRIIVPGSVSPASYYYGPSDDSKKNSVPLIVIPHGGPHSVLFDTFTPDLALMLNLGFGVLRLNYIGSIGGTEDVTEKLCGKIGTADVKYCQETVEKLLSQEPSLDPAQIAVYGGSHGGFLGACLSSAYPDVYKAVILRNPVVDLLSMVPISDITDWTFVECGVKDTSNVCVPVVNTLEDARKFMDVSPIRQANKVKGATLLLLGSEDLRVPMSQGLAYYRALIAAGKKAEVRVYNDCHSLQKVKVRFDNCIHTILWIAKHLKK